MVLSPAQMKIYTAAQIRSWDAYTIAEEPVASIDLMERAAAACTAWLMRRYAQRRTYYIFCGKGNNGGDGLAIARQLAAVDPEDKLIVFISDEGKAGSADFEINLQRLQDQNEATIKWIQSVDDFPEIPSDVVVLDALFGTGLSRKLEGLYNQLAVYLNSTAPLDVIAIDIPSGLFADQPSIGNAVIQAGHTLTFQCMKLAFLIPENVQYTGQVHVLDIGLHPGFAAESAYEMIASAFIKRIYRPRNSFAHKGNFGHALLLAGSQGKVGAAILAARACMRSGAGLLTVHTPACGYTVLQTTIPEAMIDTDSNLAYISSLPPMLDRFTTIGIGPGIGMEKETAHVLQSIFASYHHPVVVDADALNIIANRKELLTQLPAGSILTPHPKEFTRLFGETTTDFDKIKVAIDQAKQLQVVIVLKGHRTFIATPSGKGYFNSTGNPGMATAGSGDVLTGILTGLLAQGYGSEDAAIFGVYLHGLAGDIAATNSSMETMLASDIINSLGEAYYRITSCD